MGSIPTDGSIFMPYEDDVRAFYRRFAIALKPEDQQALQAQLDVVKITWLDIGHDKLELPSDFSGPKFTDPGIVIDPLYSDADGEPVNVIIHCVDGMLSWAERYRCAHFGPVINWPPAPETELKFPVDGKWSI